MGDLDTLKSESVISGPTNVEIAPRKICQIVSITIIPLHTRNGQPVNMFFSCEYGKNPVEGCFPATCPILVPNPSCLRKHVSCCETGEQPHDLDGLRGIEQTLGEERLPIPGAGGLWQLPRV